MSPNTYLLYLYLLLSPNLHIIYYHHTWLLCISRDHKRSTTWSLYTFGNLILLITGVQFEPKMPTRNFTRIVYFYFYRKKRAVEGRTHIGVVSLFHCELYCWPVRCVNQLRAPRPDTCHVSKYGTTRDYLKRKKGWRNDGQLVVKCL